MSAPWWEGMPPAAAELECGASRHVVAWADGTLLASAHPDVERERMLTALGADAPPCIEVLDAWRRHEDDLDVLILASRGPADSLDVPANPGGFGWVAYAPARPPRTSYRYSSAQTSSARRFRGPRQLDGARTEALTTLLRLGNGLPERLTATVFASWLERVASADESARDVMPQLQAAVYGRLVASVRAWRGNDSAIRFTALEPGDRPTISRQGETLDIALPLGWLLDVWARGLSSILGRLCLAAERDGAGGWRLLTVGTDLGPPQQMTVTFG